MGGSASKQPDANNTFGARGRVLGTTALAVGGLLVAVVAVRWFRNNNNNHPARKPVDQGQRAPQGGNLVRDMDDITGVTLAVLEALTHHAKFRPGMTTSEVCEEIVKLDTLARQCSYADLLRFRHDNNSLPDVVPGKVHREANVFVSHVWDTPFQDVVDTLKTFLEHNGDLEASSTYFWFDMLVKNQHNLHNQVIDTDQLKTVFRTSLRRIGRVVAVFTPWNKPTYTTRIWCLWEVLCAVDTGCDFDIFMPPSDHASFLRALTTNFHSILGALCNVDVTHAQAREEADRIAILEAVAQSDGGVTGINARVVGCMNEWLARAAQVELDQRKKELEGAKNYEAQAELERMERDIARLENNMGLLFSQQHDLGRALPLYERALKTTEAIDLQIEEAKTLNNLALLYHNQGDIPRARELFERALEIKTEAHGPNHQEVASTLHNLGDLYLKQNELDRALPLYKRALAITEKALGPKHPEGDIPRARELYERALEIKTKVHGPNHVEVARTLHNLACLHMQGNPAEARQLLERALKIFKTQGNPHTQNVQAALRDLP